MGRPTVVTQPSVRTLAVSDMLAPLAVEYITDPPSAFAVGCVFQVPVAVPVDSGATPKIETNELAFVNAEPT